MRRTYHATGIAAPRNAYRGTAVGAGRYTCRGRWIGPHRGRATRNLAARQRAPGCIRDAHRGTRLRLD